MLLESLKIALGTPASDFALNGTDNKTHTLADYKDTKMLVIVFTCNHCPYAQAVWPRLIDLQKKYKNYGVQFIAINPNYNPAYPDDSFEKMKEYEQKIGINMPYLQDSTQNVARAYQAQCTPDIFVYDKDRNLAYHGRVDDNWKKPAKVTRHELDEAISALIKGEKPGMQQHPSMGCSIKYMN